MHKLRSMRLFLIGCAVVVAATVLGLLAPSPALADVGPQPILPGGSSLKPGEETPIQMAAETVTILVRPATEADNSLVKLNPRWYGYDSQPVWYPAVAEVQADFTLKNPTGEAVSMEVWFPLNSSLEKMPFSGDRPSEIVPRLENFTVSVGGEAVEYAVSELPNPGGADRPAVPWASFPVTFLPGVDTDIQVSYSLPLKRYPKERAMDLSYIFQTGAGWAGPIGQAELVVNLPYPASEATLAKLPAGAELAGNQARWSWQDLEPGPEDDFRITLLPLDTWQELEAARQAVQANPQNGQAWLELASQYFYLAVRTFGRLFPLTFGSSYNPQAIQAYQKAADLLPDHPIPHIALALLKLAPYMEEKNAPSGVLQAAQKEAQIAQELAAKDPSLMEDTQLMDDWKEALFAYFYNDATATVVEATRAVVRVTETANFVALQATQTIEATLNHATGTAYAVFRETNVAAWETDMACWAAAGAGCTATAPPTWTQTPNPTLTPQPSATATLAPSATPLPALLTPTLPVRPESEANQRQGLIITLATGVISLVIVAYLVVRRYRRQDEDEEDEEPEDEEGEEGNPT
jgi:hypothetical protein